MDLKEFLEKRGEKRLQRLEERDERRREDRKNGVKLPAKIARTFRQMSIPGRIGTVFLIVAIVSGGVFGAYFFAKRKAPGPDEMEKRPDGMGVSDVVTATGTTTVGMTEEKFDVDSLETSLKIEEVYLNSGDVVEKGAKILKISDESLEEARTELEQAARSAEYAYRLGVVDHEEALITAKSTYDEAAVNSAYADNDYQSEVNEKAKKVSELEKEVTDAQKIVDEYTASNEEDYYYTYYKIDELKEELYQNFTLLMQLYDEWEIEELSKSSTSGMGQAQGTTSNMDMSQNSNSGDDQSKNANSGTDTSKKSTSGEGESKSTQTTSDTSNNSSSGEGQAQDVSSGTDMSQAVSIGQGSSQNTKSDKLTLYQDFDKEVQEEQEEYDAALENYEDAKRKAATNLEKEKANLEKLKAELTEARVAYDEAVVSAGSTKKETVAKSSIAEDTYNTSVEKADEELATLKDAMDEATENLTAFNESISDGYMYTSTAGTIMMVAVSEGATLSGDSLVIAYTDESTISVSASVSQEDIAKLSVGQAANVMFEDYGNFDGVITSIDPNTASGSRSSVTYTVTVELLGDVSNLSQNLTASVIFLNNTGEVAENGDT